MVTRIKVDGDFRMFVRKEPPAVVDWRPLALATDEDKAAATRENPVLCCTLEPYTVFEIWWDGARGYGWRDGEWDRHDDGFFMSRPAPPVGV